MTTDVLDMANKLAQPIMALVMLWVACLAVPNELRKWRRTKYDERRAEAAAAAVIATYDLCNALDANISKSRQRPRQAQTTQQQYFSAMQDTYRESLNDVDSELATFRQARIHAHIYCKDDKELEAVADHYQSIWHDIVKWTMGIIVDPDHEAFHESQAAYTRLFVDGPKHRAQLRERVSAAFADEARYGVRD